MSLKAILFDVDGVLLDSTEANIEFYRELFRQIGSHQPDEQLLRSGMHLSVETMLRQVLPDLPDVDIYKWMIQADTIDAGFSLLKPMPGVLETLPKLSTYSLGLVTNRTVAGVDELWRIVPRRDLFTSIAAYEDTLKHKPDPEPIHFVLNQLTVQPNEAIFVGDAQTDLDAGLAAGVPVIMLGSKNWPEALATISTFSELPNILK